MKTIPLEDFLKKHDLVITITQRHRRSYLKKYLQIYRLSHYATLRSRDGECFHFIHGNFVEGKGDTKLEAFNELIAELNRNAELERKPIYSARLDRLANAVRTIPCPHLLDAWAMSAELD